MKKLIPMLLIALAACTSEPEPAPHTDEGGAGSAPTNRIDIPPAVVSNLGITFAKVERRHVEQTIRLPGVFEVPPEAEREYRAPVGGRVTLLVNQYDHVGTGDELARIDSAQWRDMQRELDAIEADLTARQADVVMAQAERAAAEADIEAYPRRIEAYQPHLDALAAHRERLIEARDLWQTRVQEIEELIAKGAGKATELAEARAQLATAQSALSEEAEKRAELERERAELAFSQQAASARLPVLIAAETSAQSLAASAERSFKLKVRATATLLNVEPAALDGGAWRAIDTVVVMAGAPGMVMDLRVRQGDTLQSGDSLFHVMDASRTRFRARGLQSDLGRLKDGLAGRVVAPAGGTLEGAEAARGTISIAPMADGDARLVDVLLSPQTRPAWARPGVGAELEVVWDATQEPMLAVPARCIVRDGLDLVFFVRDAADANKAIRTKADVGPSDGRWTVVYSGVMEGSEVVLDGTYELKLTGAGKPTGAGHFHADGTWHAGADHD